MYEILIPSIRSVGQILSVFGTFDLNLKESTGVELEEYKALLCVSMEDPMCKRGEMINFK